MFSKYCHNSGCRPYKDTTASFMRVNVSLNLCFPESDVKNRQLQNWINPFLPKGFLMFSGGSKENIGKKRDY